MSTPVKFDPEKLDALKEYRDENDQDLRISIVKTYFEETKKLLADLKKTQDAKNLSHIAHSLKSSTAAVGGDELSVLFAALEAGKFNEVERSQAIQKAEKLFTELQGNLNQYLKKAA